MDHLDYLKDAIAEREARLSALDQERLKVEAELGAYREMLAKFQTPVPLTTPRQSRPPVLSPSSFTMSREWITVFKALDQRAGKSFDAADVEHVGSLNGIHLTTPSIRSQFAHYSERGYLRKVQRGKYTITPKGREKFAAAEQNLSEGSKENGPPKGGPETGVTAPNFNLVSGGKENA